MEANPDQRASEDRAALSARMSRIAKPGRAKHPSRLLTRGILPPNTPEARFLGSVEARSREGLGHAASFAEQMLIRRCARLMLQLELLDRKENPSEHDLRAGAAWENRARLLLVTLNGKRNGGLERKVMAQAEGKAEPEPEKPEPLAEYLERKGRERAGSGHPLTSPRLSTASCPLRVQIRSPRAA